ncbi:hypothetical protein LSTR_LSTR014174 [Laodelphax striatellus]|uniref:Complex 1 LYR protein domain-containing protein n=1 Tax=Laodelphax striatellus TaxID=195883 RepID=A0A482WQP2_LAOST|nr:hypothetical protein LSTR_LSTR014174 [Laodelphax striatellus]
MSVGRQQVLRLYKDLLKYGQNLKFTDKAYFEQRIKSEFKKHKSLEKPSDKQFHFERGQQLLINARIL